MRIAAWLLAALVLAGCGSSRQVRDVQPQGFLGDYSRLTTGASGEAALRYINPDADWASYDKVIVEPESQRVLGVGIVGPQAGDMISEAVVAIEMGCTARDVAESIHPHPTLSETQAFAGEAYLGTATEVYRPKRKQAPVEA